MSSKISLESLIVLFLTFLLVGLPFGLNLAESVKYTQTYGTEIYDVGFDIEDYENLFFENNITGKVDQYVTSTNLRDTTLHFFHSTQSSDSGEIIYTYSLTEIGFNDDFDKIEEIQTDAKISSPVYIRGLQYYNNHYWGLQQMEEVDYFGTYNLLKFDDTSILMNESLHLYNAQSLKAQGFSSATVRWMSFISDNQLLIYIPHQTFSEFSANLTLINLDTLEMIESWSINPDLHDPFISDNQMWFKVSARGLEGITHTGGGNQSVSSTLIAYNLDRFPTSTSQSTDFDFSSFERTVFNHWTSFVRPSSSPNLDYGYSIIPAFVAGDILITPFIYDDYLNEPNDPDLIQGVQIREITKRNLLFYYTGWDAFFTVLGLIILSPVIFRRVKLLKTG